ncbi:hypothetical protein H0H92_012734, partial [Tricholoma furcatifolium]
MAGERKVPPGTIDENDTVECVDCGTIVHCGKVGISNLAKRHVGSKACREAAAKRDRSGQKKNMSILGFLRPKATHISSLAPPPPTPLGIASPSSTQPEKIPEDGCTPSQNHHVHFLHKLRSLVAHLPHSVPEAGPDDKLADFSGDPARAVDSRLTGEEIWEEMLNQALKNCLGYGKSHDLTNIIKRGALGMNGFIRFIEYFVLQRAVPEALVEQKLEHLIESLERMTTTESSKPDNSAVPSLVPQSLNNPASDSDIEVITSANDTPIPT